MEQSMVFHDVPVGVLAWYVSFSGVLWYSKMSQPALLRFWDQDLPSSMSHLIQPGLSFVTPACRVIDHPFICLQIIDRQLHMRHRWSRVGPDRLYNQSIYGPA